MSLEDQEVRYLVLDLLKQESERDKQRKIGPSQIGNPCDYCLGLAVLGRGGSRYNHWWMGARIGTAIHESLEVAAQEHVERPREAKFNALHQAGTELKVYVGEAPGYGMITGSADLVLLRDRHLVDYKTTTRKKIDKLKIDGPPEQYHVQQQLYMYGLNGPNHQLPIERASLVFICRDGSSDADVWVSSFDYDPSVAEHALERLGKIAAYLNENGADAVEQFESHADCWTCTNKYLRT